MKKTLINFLKGFLGGIANIIPGLSGSSLLVIFNLYDKCIEAISNLFKNFKTNFLFLFPIGLGIFVGTFLFSNIIYLCLKNFSLETSIIFSFFIIGTLPALFNKIDNKISFKYILFLLISFFLGISLLFIKNKAIITFNYNFFSLIITGVLLAISTIIPGISSTVLLTLINTYNLYLNAINTLNIKVLLPIIISFLITFFLLSKIINYLLKKYRNETFYTIIGFVIATIPALIKEPIILNKNLFISIIIGILFAITTYFVSSKEKNYEF